MKLACLLALTLLSSCGQVDGRMYTQRECKILATVAGQSAGYRENKVAFPQVLADFKQAAINESKTPNPLIHYIGDYEFVLELITLSYNTGWPSDVTYKVVYTVCDQHGDSRYVREI